MAVHRPLISMYIIHCKTFLMLPSEEIELTATEKKFFRTD